MPPGELVGTVASALGIVGFLGGAYVKFVRPRRRAIRIRRFCALVQEWFDMIDGSDIINLSLPALDVQEKRVAMFLRDNKLEDVRLCFSPKFRRKFLTDCGIKGELRDSPELFEKYSGCPVRGTDLKSFWWSMLGAFYEFRKHYEAQDGLANFGNVEMRVKLLKAYSGVLTA